MSIYDEASKRVGTGLYLKLDAGEKRIRLLEDPYVSTRPGFNDGDPIRTVFSWIVWNYEENRIQVLEQGKGLFNQVAAVVKQWGEQMPMNCDLVITTTGSGLETKRTVVAVPHNGTMPPTAVLRKDPSWPDLESLTSGVPLARFAKEGLPEDAPVAANPPETEVRADGRSGDVIIKDLDDSPVNLDDIPF